MFWRPLNGEWCRRARLEAREEKGLLVGRKHVSYRKQVGTDLPKYDRG